MNVSVNSFSSFPDHFGQLGNFVQVGLKQKNYPVQTKKKLSSNLVTRVPSFYIRTKSKLKNRVTTVHLLQCKTNVFICICIWGRSQLQVKEYRSWEASINTKNKFFDSFTLVYNCLGSSTLVYIGLESSDSSTFVYIHLLSSTVVCVFRTDH